MIKKKGINIIKRRKVKQDDKTSKLFSKIIYLLAVCFVLIFVAILFCKDFANFRSENITTINDLKKRKTSIKGQISDLENKTVAAKKFISIWRDELSPAKKSKSGISINNATELLRNISKKNNIKNLQMNFSNPVTLMGDFKKNSIQISTTLITIYLDTITDINVLNFIRDIEEEFPNFVILTELDMSRTNKINDDYFDSLRRGSIVPTLKAELKIRWYGISSMNE